MAISEPLLVLKRPGHFETYLKGVNKIVFWAVDLIVKTKKGSMASQYISECN